MDIFDLYIFSGSKTVCQARSGLIVEWFMSPHSHSFSEMLYRLGLNFFKGNFWVFQVTEGGCEDCAVISFTFHRI